MCIFIHTYKYKHIHTHKGSIIITIKTFYLHTAQPSRSPTSLPRERHTAGFLFMHLGQAFRWDLRISSRQQLTYRLQGPANWLNKAIKSNSLISTGQENIWKCKSNCQNLVLRDIWQLSPNALWLSEKKCVSTWSSNLVWSLSLSTCSHLHLCKVNGKYYQVRMRTIYHSFLQWLQSRVAGTEFIRFKRDCRFKQIHLYYSFSKEIKHKNVA